LRKLSSPLPFVCTVTVLVWHLLPSQVLERREDEGSLMFMWPGDKKDSWVEEWKEQMLPSVFRERTYAKSKPSHVPPRSVEG